MPHSSSRISPATRRVLIVTYYWPPAGGGGVQRWLKFARHLPASGWTPVVCFPSNPDYPVLDRSLLSEVPAGLEAVSLPIREPFAWAKRLLGDRAEVGRLGAAGTESAAGSAQKPSRAVRAMRWIRGNCFVPDARVLWVRPSARALKRYLAEHPVDLILTTGPPHSVHLIGEHLKRTTGIPWVADFRDPWSDMDYLDDFYLGNRARKKQARLEALVAEKTDRIVVTAPRAAVQLIGKTASLHHDSQNKARWIPNGWDRTDFEGNAATRTDKSKPYVLGHFGSWYANRAAPGLWKAIRIWNDEAEKNGTRAVVLACFGSTENGIHEAIRMQIGAHALRVEANLPHAEAVDFMLGCDALLLVHNDSKSGQGAIPGKLFEYLACRKPVVSIGRRDSDLEDLTEAWGWDLAAHGDTVGASKMLTKALTMQKDSGDSPDPEDFERGALTGTLAAIFDEIIDSEKRNRRERDSA